MSNKLEDLDSRAAAIDREFNRKRREIRGMGDWTEAAKARMIADLDARRQASVAALQEEARAALADERARVQRALGSARAADVERQRALFGDAILIAMYREDLAKADGADVLALLESAAPGWEHDVLFALAAPLISKRLNGGELSTGLIRAGQAIDADAQNDPARQALADLAHEARQLEGTPARQFVDGLDRHAARVRLAGVMRLNYDALLETEEAQQGGAVG